MEDRVTKLCAEILSMTRRVKPLSTAKRIVITKHKLLGSNLDKICTKIVNDVERWYGPIIRILKALNLSQNEYNILFVYFVFIRKESLKNIEKRFSKFMGNADIKQKYIEIKNFEESIDYDNFTERMFWKYGFPRIYIEKLSKFLDKNFIEELAKSFLERPKFSIRTNVRKVSREELKTILERKYSINLRPSLYSEVALVSENFLDLSKCPEYKKGYFTVQDEVSSFIPLCLGVENKKLKILDVCAAPGIKTTELAELSPESTIYAIDISMKRLKSLEFHMKRLGLENISFFHMDARKAGSYFNNIDRILLDAPCSSSGTVIRNPAVKWEIKEQTIERLSKLQKELLEEAINIVKDNGIIVYSTCSLFVEENEKVIEHFLNKGEVELLEINSSLSKGISKNKDIDQKVRRSFTNIHKTSCFFIAKLKKSP